jgi:hypothetical protein
MPTNPRTNLQKMERMLNAWEALAPQNSFGGMTLEQFQAEAQPAHAARQRIADLENQLKQAIAAREEADEHFQERARRVLCGVIADPTEGPDSPLFEAMGYTRKSAIRSGLIRKSEKSSKW